MTGVAAGAGPSPETQPADETATAIGGAVVADRVYRGITLFTALCIPALLLLILEEVLRAGWPALSRFGFGFLGSRTWDPVQNVYGAGPALFGTIVTSIIALIIATPLALGVAIFLSEFAPRWLRQPVGFLVDLLAAIPSVVYGLWGIFVLIPLLRDDVVPFLRDDLRFGVLPIFSGSTYGPSILAAGLILGIMVLPYISAVAREVLMAVPRSQREAALALGATRWEMIWGAVLPYARTGILGGIILGLGRALGETMAVTMVIGNRHDIPTSLLQPGYTMASLIANEFVEATRSDHIAALMAIGFVLLVLTLIVNALARWLVWQVGRGQRG